MLKISKDEQSSVEVFNGVIRHTLACGKDVLMARFEYKKDSRVPLHKHSYEQVTTVLKGKQKIMMKSGELTKELIVESGDSYVVPPNYEHEQITQEDSVTIDAWSLAP